MTSNSPPFFKLSLKPSGFPLRLFLFTIMGVVAASILMTRLPNPIAVLMVLVSDILIILMIYLLYPVISRLDLGRGLVAVWYACMLVPGGIYLFLPWIETLLFGAPFTDADHEVTRIYLLALGLFIIPVVLGMEQLEYAQFEVKVLEKEQEVSDLDFRIRPHFFFNSLNSVASLIAVDPLRAEEGLLDLADMFRIILTDKRKLVPLSLEYELAFKYMALEKMRLGDRLQDEWKIDGIDETILLPILTLQPLIENAIYHGIETRSDGGTVSIQARQSQNRLYITITNPMPEVGGTSKKGNQIAHKNLTDRFQHLYRGEASIEYVETAKTYVVTIEVPANFSAT